MKLHDSGLWRQSLFAFDRLFFGSGDWVEGECGRLAHMHAVLLQRGRVDLPPLLPNRGEPFYHLMVQSL
jgi:hypothetical protein